jgi:hypothetical protein
MTIKHSVVTAQPNDPAKDVSADAWNDNHVISGGLDLPLETVPTPPANTVRLFGYKVGGRMMAAFKGPSGLDTTIQPSLARNKIAWMNPVGNTTTLSQVGFALSAVGTATAANVATTNLHVSMRRIDYLVTTAATTAVAGITPNGTSNNQYFMGTGILGGFHVILRFGGATGMSNTAHRFYAGMVSSTSAPTDVEPNTRSGMIGVGYGSADANWKIMHKTASGAATEIDLGAAFPRQTADRSKMYELALFCPPGGTNVGYEFTELGTSNVASGEITTNLPTASTLLKWTIIASVGGISSVIGLALASAYTETDY